MKIPQKPERCNVFFCNVTFHLDSTLVTDFSSSTINFFPQTIPLYSTRAAYNLSLHFDVILAIRQDCQNIATVSSHDDSVRSNLLATWLVCYNCTVFLLLLLLLLLTSFCDILTHCIQNPDILCKAVGS